MRRQPVQVAVRCRPATKHDRGGAACIAVEGDAVTVASGEEEAGFSFDVCLGMEADQRDVYDALVSEPMEALFEGYNSTILAYGQTGSGKTYSMVGTEDEPGLIPRFARELFERRELHPTAEHVGDEPGGGPLVLVGPGDQHGPVLDVLGLHVRPRRPRPTVSFRNFLL